MAIRVNKKQQIPKDNYIIFHHTGKSYVIPVDPDSITDNHTASFATNFPLSRSAPIYSYQNSGPRTVQVAFTLHRDLCQQFNPNSTDMVEELITNLEGLILPDYESANKVVNPPIVSMKIRDEIYIKGVVTGGIGKQFNLPILNYNGQDKYALVNLNFSISEIEPQTASILPSRKGGRRLGS